MLGSAGWERKSLQNLWPRFERDPTRDRLLRDEAELLGSGLRTRDQIAEVLNHRSNRHRFYGAEDPPAPTSTGLAPTLAPGSNHRKGAGGRFNLLEHRARQVATRVLLGEVAPPVDPALVPKPAPPTGLLQHRDPKTGALYKDRH